ncbi:MAG: hypothetical protein AAFY84_10910 [Pseudomonadota bacterium]
MPTKLARVLYEAPISLLLTSLAVFMFAFHTAAETPDVSWLTDMCMRILAGEQAYVDIFETTPPIPTLLYMPGAAAEFFLGIAAEPVIIAYLSVFYVFTLIYAAHLAPKSLEGVGSFRTWFIAPAAIFIFVLSHDTFAQREAVALAAMTPLVASCLKRVEGNDWPAWYHQLAIGFLAGFGAAVKPPILTVPLMLLGLYLLVRERRLDTLLKSGLITSAAVFTAMTAVSLALFPEYITGVVPLMKEVYVRTTVGLATYLGSTTLFLLMTIAVTTMALIRRTQMTPTLGILMIMAGGFFAVFMMQGKMFHYHALPAVYFGFLALSCAAGLAFNKLKSAEGKRRNIFGIKLTPAQFDLAFFGLAAFAVVPLISYNLYADKQEAFSDLSWAKDLDRPTALSISPSINICFPLSRSIKAKWIDRIHSQWVVRYANVMLSRSSLSEEEREPFERWRENELKRVVQLIQDEKPEIIIHDIMEDSRDVSDGILSYAPDLLEPYAPIAEDRGVRILRLKTAIAADNGPDLAAHNADKSAS